MLATANQFERIASAEQKEWLPRYYASLIYVYMGFMGKDAAEKDKYLDQADKYLKEALALSQKNDELAVLKAFIAQSRMVVDPMNRWQTYGPAFQDALTEAKSAECRKPTDLCTGRAIIVLHTRTVWRWPQSGLPDSDQSVRKIRYF